MVQSYRFEGAQPHSFQKMLLVEVARGHLEVVFLGPSYHEL